MRLSPFVLVGFALTTFAVPGAPSRALADPPVDPPGAPKSSVKSEVTALLKQATGAYKQMKSYRHTALYVLEGKNPTTGETVKRETRYTLALERPNRFAYKNDSRPQGSAVSDGKTFVNFRGGQTPQYTRQKAPADFKGINIVDDVVFEPLATYVIALMLQGDALADKDVRDAMEKATLKPGLVTENGKKWQVLVLPFGQQDPTEIYFSTEDHLIGKAFQMGKVKISETIESIRIDKPIEPTVFSYTLPESAKQIEKFVAPSRPNDA